MKNIKKSLFYCLMVLFATLVVFTGCKKNLYMFQPIVNAQSHYNSTQPTITWDVSKLLEGETFLYEVYKLDAQGVKIEPFLFNGSGGEQWVSETPLEEGRYCFVLWKERPVRVDGEDIQESSLKTEVIFSILTTAPSHPDMLEPNVAYSSKIVEVPRVDDATVMVDNACLFVSDLKLSWKWSLPQGAEGFKVRAGKGIETQVVNPDDNTVKFEYSLDSGNYADKNKLDRTFVFVVPTPAEEVKWLGPYVVEVRSVDLAGNLSAPVFHALWVDLDSIPGPAFNNPALVVDKTIAPPKEFLQDGNRTNDSMPLIAWQSCHPTGFPSAATEYKYQISSSDVPDEDRWSVVNLAEGDALEYKPQLPLKEGKYNFFVQAIFPLDRVSSSSVLPFEIDSTAPVVPAVSINLPVVNTLPADITWDWTVNEDVVKIEYDYNSYGVLEKLLDDALFLTHSETLVADYPVGTYSLKVRAFDSLGNASAWVTSSFLIDLKVEGALRISIDGAQYDSTADIWITNKLQPVFNWTDGSTATEFAYYLHDRNLGEITVAPDEGVWNSLGVLTSHVESEDMRLTGFEGNYSFYVRQKIDSVWSTFDQYGVAHLLIDLKAPVAPVVTSLPVVGADPATGRGYPEWNWTKSEDVVQFRYRLSIGGVVANWIIGDGDITTYSKECMGSMDGISYILEVQACDSIGNWSETGQSVTSVSTNLPPAPTVSIGGGVSVTSSTTIEWAWNYALIEAAGYTVSDVWVKVGSAPLGSETVYSGGTTYQENFSVSANAEIQKTLYVVVKCTKADNTVMNSTAGYATVTIDLKGPQPPYVSGEDQTSDFSPVFSPQPKDPADHAGYRWQVKNSGTPVDGNWIVEANVNAESIQVAPPLSAIGEYVFYLQSKDAYGNWSESASKAFELVKGPDVPTGLVLVDPLFDLNKTNLAKPTFKWSYATAVNELNGFRYRCYSKGTDPSSIWSFITIPRENISTDYSFEVSRSVSQGDVICELQVSKIIGGKAIYSNSISFEIFVDSIAPPAPVMTYPTSKTEDTTPEMTWNVVANSSYVWSLYSGDSLIQGGSSTGVITDSAITAVTLATLSPGSYVFKILSEDTYKNKSAETSFNFEIGTGAGFTNPSVPTQPILRSVSKGELGNAVRIEWVRDSRAKKYIIYRMTQEQIDDRNYIPSNGTAVLSLSPLSQENNGYENVGEGYCAFYDETVPDFGNYYYSVVAANDEDAESPATSLAVSVDREKARGLRFGKFNEGSFVATNSVAGLRVSWESIEGASVSYLSRSNSSTYVAEPSGIVDWQYFSTGNSWVSEGAYVEDSARKEVLSPFENGDGFTDGNFFYFKMIANSGVDRAKIDSEGILTGKYYQSRPYYTSFLPTIDNDWFAVGRNDSNYAGKIPVTITVPATYQHYTPYMNFEVYRTYNYGGGYRGANSGVGTPGTFTVDTNAYPLFPNPDDSPEIKTIKAYTISGTAFSGGSYVCADTLYDTDANEDKLFACLPTDSVPNASQTYVTNASYTEETSRVVRSWHLLTQAQIDAYAAAGQTWHKVLDPDGTPSEHEWHYLLWDWAIRKQLGARNVVGNSSNKFADFDFTKMVECDYKVRLVDASNPSNFSDTTTVKKGVPALTPREFANLGEILREISFYSVEATVHNATVCFGFTDQPETGTYSGKRFGTITASQKSNSGLGGNMQIEVLVKVSAAGISDLEGCSIQLGNGNGWNLWIMGSDTTKSGHQYTRGDMQVVTPLYSGTVHYYMSFKNGTKWHNVGGGTIGVTFDSFSAYDVKDNMGYPSYGSSWIINEVGVTGWMERAIVDGNGQWSGRHTDINFIFRGVKYPGAYNQLDTSKLP